ncbi:NAD(P)/FAD-dependent oxidoreductase [Limobrevibacterium gyesilva]|uniref:NAD(P)/FAD-dependent oxidoreductase n=1 Tax=Limobrevibacterium gyesilva TaxID=2991712 RepID=A0AA42CF88_9PROT|nr:NAD(P)/FAD-dependent oxidoreductase [Limobrevibacterium gyesilva]MCW3474511.1 NAD(P)/FAD-dependent oxidoreductase [Limobrevibacterium gyesilva]
MPEASTPASSAATTTAPASLHQIVVVGGGAAGLELVTRLGDTLGRRGRAQITLVERARTHLWKPLLHSVAAGSMDPGEHELNYLAQAHWHHFRYRLGEMIGLDRRRKEVWVAASHDEEGREITPARSIPYDTLVIAVGSVTNDFGTKGAIEHAVPLETPEQAVRFNHRLVNACIRAHSQPGAVRPGQLHVAIIGAGATGTELAAELHRTARQVVAHGLDRVDPERDIRIILIEAADRILPALPERIADATGVLLKDLGVEVRTRARVSEVRADGVCLVDGAFIPSELVVWSAGVKAPAFLQDLDGLETNRLNQLVVTPTLQCTRDPDIFAIGDCAACPREGHTTPVPPRAQAAHQQASHLLRQFRRRLQGGPLEPFRYRDFGSLVSLGEYSTVGSLMGFLVGRSMFIEGMFARLMYESLYKMHELALHGGRRTVSSTLARGLSRRGGPQVKLH